MRPWEQTTSDTIIQEIRLLRNAQPERTFLVIEGEDDRKFWSNHVDSTACDLVVGHGRLNVLGAVALMDGQQLTDCAAQIDTDFDHIEPGGRQSPNLFRTDTHDLETLLFRGPALTKVLNEHGDSRKVRNFENRRKATVADALLERGLPFGRLRWAIYRHKWSFSMRDLPVSRFVEAEQWNVPDVDALCVAISKLRDAPSLNEIVRRVNDLPSTADPWSICNGHDLAEILAIGLLRVLGKVKKAEVSGDRVESWLRLAAETTYMLDTQMGKSMSDWERQRQPRRFFAVRSDRR